MINKLIKNNITKLMIISVFLITAGVFVLRAEENKQSTTKKILQTDNALNEVESKYVCMVTNKLFQKQQIPVIVEGKTYYGCCEMCKGRLANDASSRTSVDPVSGNPVDKAKSIIAATKSGDIYYFENKGNLKVFNNKFAEYSNN